MKNFSLVALLVSTTLTACGESTTKSTATDTTQTANTTSDTTTVGDSTSATSDGTAAADTTTADTYKGSPAGACLTSDAACIATCKSSQCAGAEAAFAADPKASVLAKCLLDCKAAGATGDAAACVTKCLDTAGKATIKVLVDQQACEATKCWKCAADDAACVDSCAGQRCTEAGLACMADAQCAACLSDKGVAVACIGKLPEGSAASAAGKAFGTCVIEEVPGCQGK